jgi:hypothetical protein
MFVKYGDELVEYEQINPNVLSLFNITKKEQFEGISDRLKKAFYKD